MQQKSLQRDLAVLEKKKERLEELVEAGAYTILEFKSKVEPLNVEIATKKLELSETSIDTSELELCVNYSLKFLNQLPTFYNDLEIEHKVKLNSALFPKGIKYQNSEIATIEMISIYRPFKSSDAYQLSNGDPGGNGRSIISLAFR